MYMKRQQSVNAKKIVTWFGTGLLVVLAVYQLNVHAQANKGSSKSTTRRVSYKQNTTLNFSGGSIEGKMKTPNATFLNAKQAAKFKSIIDLKRRFSHKIPAATRSVQSHP